jgi:hypothetical protein
MMQSVIDYFNKPILKLPLLFGLATGVLAFLFFLGLYTLDIMPLGKILDFGIYLIMIAGACWYYRKTVGKGMLHLWEALTIGYVVNCVAALVNGWLIYAFITFVDPALFTQYTSEMLHLLDEGKVELIKNIKEPEYMKMYNEIKSMEPSVIIKDEISKKMIMGIIPILIISLILRKQNYGIYHNKS